MPEKIKLPCFVCRSPKEDWKPIALKYLLDNDDLCDLHKALAQEKIKSMPVEKEELKIPGSFLPEIPKKFVRNYQEPREPGMEG